MPIEIITPFDMGRELYLAGRPFRSIPVYPAVPPEVHNEIYAGYCQERRDLDDVLMGKMA